MRKKCAYPQFYINCKVTVAGYDCSWNSFLMLWNIEWNAWYTLKCWQMWVSRLNTNFYLLWLQWSQLEFKVQVVVLGKLMGDILVCSYFLDLSVKVTVDPSVRAEWKAVVGLVLTNVVFVFHSITKTSYAGLAPCMEILQFLFYVK